MPGLIEALGLGLGQRPGGGGAPLPPPPPPPPPSGLALPQLAAIAYRMDPATIAGYADGAQISGYTDPNSGLAAMASANVYYGSTYANGRPGLYFINSAYLDLGRPGALTTPMSSSSGWSAMVVFSGASASGAYGSVLGDNYGGGLFMNASGGGVGFSAQNYDYRSGDAGSVHALMYSGDAGAGPFQGRMYLDGTMISGPTPQSIGSGNIRIGMVPAGGNNFGFVGTIGYVAIWNTKLSAAEALQAYLWACAKFGKTSPLAGMTFFPVFDGDSITEGVGATPNTSFPEQLAIAKGWPLGAYANVGKPSAGVAAGFGGGNNLIDSAARDVDQFRTMFNAAGISLPIRIVAGEWFNQGGGGTSASGAATAGNNRAYAAARKAADPGATLIGWTSTTSYDRNGAMRDGFNASLVGNPGAFDLMIPVHTDPYIGTDAAAPAVGGGTYFADNVHPNAAGAAKLKDLIGAVL